MIIINSCFLEVTDYISIKSKEGSNKTEQRYFRSKPYYIPQKLFEFVEEPASSDFRNITIDLRGGQAVFQVFPFFIVE